MLAAALHSQQHMLVQPSVRVDPSACVCSELRRQLEDVSQERSADAHQAQREIEVGSRQLAAAQQQLQLKADIIHQLTGGLQVPCTAHDKHFFPTGRLFMVFRHPT